MRHDGVVKAVCSPLWIPTFLVLVMAPPSYTGNVPDTKGREFVLTAFDTEPSSSVTLEVIPQVPDGIHISLSTPRLNTGLNLSYLTEPRKSTFITLPSDLLLQTSGIQNKGVLVTASADVSIVMTYTNFTDTCLALPRDVLGTDYSLLLGTSDSPVTSMVAIGASFTNTTVNISGDAALISGLSSGTYLEDGETLQIQLSAYQTFLLWCGENPSGLTVTSDQPVAVWVGQLMDNHSKQFVSEMVLPANTWGKKFVLVPPSNEANFSTRIIVRSNSTLTVHSTNGVTTHAITPLTPLTLSFYQQSFVYLSASTSALVLQTGLSRPPESSATQSQMFFVPPVEQYLNHYTFALNDSCSWVCLRAINPSHDTEGFLLDGQKVSLRNLLSFFVEQKSYTIIAADSIATGFHDLDHAVPTRSFCAYASYQSEYGFRPLGMRMASLYDACFPTQATDGGLGDGLDNDCDGAVDEELFNEIDDDNDGLVDEDTTEYELKLAVVGSDSNSATSDNTTEGVDSNIIAVIASLTVAIGAILLLIGSCLLHDFLKRRRGIRSTRITPFVS